VEKIHLTFALGALTVLWGKKKENHSMSKIMGDAKTYFTQVSEAIASGELSSEEAIKAGTMPQIELAKKLGKLDKFPNPA